MSNFRYWVPVPTPTPIKTFPRRLIRKWLYLTKNITTTIGSRWGFYGAKFVGVTSNGNTLLQLNRNSPLGSKGSVLELPRDRVIYEYIKRYGFWESEESEFLARGLNRVYQNSPMQRVAMLDIGANTGLVTLQALHLSNSTAEVFLFEPVPRHAEASKHNLGHLPKIHVNEFGLSDKNGRAEIFTQTTNHGNTSLIQSVVPKSEMISTIIQLVDTSSYCEKFLNNFESYIIKCDTQGMDALILSRIPDWIWKNCESAVIEVWALNEICKKDVKTFLSMCQEFEYVSWHPNAGKEMIKLSEVSDFWLSKSGSAKNLFLSKSCL